MTFGDIISQVVSGLFSGSFLFLCAVGLALVFGAGNFFNFSHGSFFMLGGYFMVYLADSLKLPFAMGLIGALTLVGIVAWILYDVLFRRILGSGKTLSVQLLSTVAVMWILGDAVRAIWGNSFVTLKRAQWVDRKISLVDVNIPSYYVAIIVTCCAIYALLHITMRYSKYGRLVRAATNNPDMLALLGCEPQRVLRGLFIGGAMCAALGGALFVPLLTITSSTGHEMIISALLVTVIGGRGNITGVALGALIIGLLVALCNLFSPAMSAVVPFVAATLMLLIRPDGLLGSAITNLNNARA